MKFRDFISSSSIVMGPDLKTRLRTDGRGDDSARAVVNDHPSLNRLRCNFQERAPWRFINYFQIISD